jgi:hypothetical protein
MLTDQVVAGSAVELHLVMTKFGPPAATVGYEITIESL